MYAQVVQVVLCCRGRECWTPSATNPSNLLILDSHNLNPTLWRSTHGEGMCKHPH